MSSWHFNTLLNDTADLYISYTLSYNGMFTCMLGYGMFLVRRPRLFIDLLRCRSHQLSSVQRLSSTLIPVKELHKDTQRMFMMISVGDSAGFGSVCPGFNERCDVFRPVWGSARVREWRLQIYCDLWRVWSSHVVFICRHLIFLCCVMGMVFSYEVDLNMLFYIHLLSFDTFFVEHDLLTVMHCCASFIQLFCGAWDEMFSELTGMNQSWNHTFDKDVCPLRLHEQHLFTR